MEKIKISAVIIARNEEEKIGECLKFLSWADEIIVINNASTDKTSEVAKKYKARVVNASDKLTLNYAGLRNLGLKEANGEWILYVDADERATESLRDEINQLISKSVNRHNAYAIPRRNFIFGKEFRHGEQWPNYAKRLFLKSAFKKWTGELHEEPNYLYQGKVTHGHNETIGYLENPLIHLKATDLSEMVAKTNEWSEIEARLMFEAGHPPMNVFRFFSAAFREFWKRFVLQAAFLDGTEGVIYGIYQIYSRLISYAKLWELQIK